MAWNYGDMVDGLATVVAADKPAHIHGGVATTWASFTAPTNRLAHHLRARGICAGDKVSFHLRNGPAYSELLGACFKARLTHVNVNYRYVEDELLYIIDNSDSAVVVFDVDFADRIAPLGIERPRLFAEQSIFGITPGGSA